MLSLTPAPGAAPSHDLAPKATDHLLNFASWLREPTHRGRGDVHGPYEDEESQRQGVEDTLLKYSVLLEYEHLQHKLPVGMHVMPDSASVLTWHGVMFPSRGPYRGGVFKFEVALPLDYPASPPGVRFATAIFHPLVDPDTGRIDIAACFDWVEGRDYATKVLLHMHRAMHKQEYLAGTTRPALNRKARELFTKDNAEFGRRAAESATQSVRSVDSGQPTEPFHMASQDEDDGPDRILQHLRATADQTMDDREEQFMDWFVCHYVGQPETPR